MSKAFDKRIHFIALAVNEGLSTALFANEWYALNKSMHHVPNEKAVEHFREAIEWRTEMLMDSPFGKEKQT